MAPQGVSGAGGPSKGSNMGVLHTGYLEKYNPANRHTKKRFVVLTHVGLHWFKRESGYDLFGEERGSLNVGELTKCTMSAGDSGCTFEVATREERRTFTATTKEEAAAWVNAISTAMRNRSLYRRETLNNLSFLNHGDDSVPNCVMATLKRADGQELVLERSLMYAKTFSVPADSPDDTLAILLSDGTSAEVTVRALLTKPVGGDNFPVRVDLDNVVANLLMAVERAEDVPRKQEETVMAALLGPDFVAPSVLIGLLSAFMVADGELTLERGLSLLVLVLVALRPALLAKERSLRGDKRPVLTLCVDDYVVTKRDENGGSDVADLPKRFIDGCFGDMVEAERRWRLTKQWRVEFGTDDILEQEHPYFDDIKKCLPAYYCYAGYDGNPVYYERSGRTDLALARAIGIDWLVWHYVYTTEFLYLKLHARESAKTITIFDVEGMGLKDVAGEPFEFIRRASHVMQEHYPERCRVIIIANAPGWFSFVWKMIRPLVNEATQKKIRITKAGDETFRAISEFVDPKHIPTDYGGSLTCGDEPDSCRWHSPEETALREHAYAVNKRFEEERKKRGETLPAKYSIPPPNADAVKHHNAPK